MIAAAPRGSLPSLPDMYIRKMAVGPRVRGKISLQRPFAAHVRAIARAFVRMVAAVTAIVLDRARPHDLLDEVPACFLQQIDLLDDPALPPVLLG